MTDSEVEISSDLQWSCVAAGKPRPSVRWLRNGQPLSTQVTQHTHTADHKTSEEGIWHDHVGTVILWTRF